MIQWEEVALIEATHIEINSVVHEIKERGGMVIVERSLDFGSINILVGMRDWVNIPQDIFPTLGIKCLRKFKPKPIEFEATFASYDGNWRPLYSLDDRFPDNCKKAKFKCVEILEEKE